MLVIGCEDDKSDDTSNDEAEIDGEIRRHSYQDATTLSHVFGLIAGFCRTSTADWVFATSTEACNTAADDLERSQRVRRASNSIKDAHHHPKHSQLAVSMCSCRDDDTQDQEERSENDARSSTDLIDDEPEEKLSEDLADEVGV